MTNTFFKSYWKSILFTLLLFYLSFARPASFKDINVMNLTDKWAHYLVYVAYGMVIIFDYIKRNSLQYNKTHFVIYCIIFPIVLGGLIEIVQEMFFKPRSAEWIDWLCDILGILSAWLLMNFAVKHIKSVAKLL